MEDFSSHIVNSEANLAETIFAACHKDLKSNSHRDEIAAARASLKESSPLLHSVCSACLEHSDVASLTASKDSVCQEIQNALDVISKASQGIEHPKVQQVPQSASLGSALDELASLVALDSITVSEEQIRPSLEKRLEGIISGAALLADSSCTRDLHRERIITECNAIRQALQDLLSEYMNNANATADLDPPTDPKPVSETPSTSKGKKKGPFHRPPVAKEEIPTPEMFLEVLKSQWVPEVDKPIATLALVSAVITGDIASCLKAENNKVDGAVVGAAEGQASEVRLLQDISKILAATQFSADTTLDAVKYVSWTMSSSMASRRLLWLHHWQAESRMKWHLTGADYTGDKLFGTALDPILVEDKNKRKVFPATTRRSDFQHAPYPRRSSYRSSDVETQNQRYQNPRSHREGDRQFHRDRFRDQQQGKWPFREGGSRPFRRFK
ncbi:PREDICTED: uncharacterized protein LOC106554326 [Thamnophis sirtalis]|uniref:Uncharacterized protein LOC106554326 n=1 Tax=Thamnophis sirtalis TaxID=35019 RepID=A0A6I9YXY1_9SAUR|nr:PREDICTED: uncharacterized protein LOC106554326 [Thamnophis sirtalis]